MTVTEKISMATDLLNMEGYRVDRKMMVFSLLQSRDIELDTIKSFVKVSSRCNYRYSPDEMAISFELGIKKIDNDVNTTEENRKLAVYINHMCDVVDQLNDLNIVLKRDLSELNLT